MRIQSIQSQISDNMFYLLMDDDGRGALIDPVDADAAVAATRAHGCELLYIINTHFHGDHVRGNPGVKRVFPEAVIAASQADAETIDAQVGAEGGGVELTLQGGETLSIGELQVQIIDTPGHTPGHISLFVETHLFCGDTIFVGGAGNCKFGGDAGQLYRTFSNVLRQLPPETTIYPGHNYAVRNLEFALSLLPGWKAAQDALRDFRRASDEGRHILTTLGEEMLYNPFMRYDDEALLSRLKEVEPELFEQQRVLSDSDEEAAFRLLREMRNHW